MLAAAQTTTAGEDAILALFYVAVLAGMIALMVVSYQKGRPALCWLGLIGLIFPLVGACRLAKPGSPWYVKRYGHGKRKRSWERWEQTPYEASILPAAPVKAWHEA